MLTRRKFLKAVSWGAAGLAAAGALPAAAFGDEPVTGHGIAPEGADSAERSCVVVARSGRLLQESRRIDPAVCREVVRRSVCALTGDNDAREAWRSLFIPDDVVGIKVNCIGKAALSSQVALVETIVDGLASIGVTRVIVWDRMDEELEAAGFPIRTSGGPYLCYGTNHRGVGYSPALLFAGEIGSLFSRILTEHCSAVINVPVLKDHDLAGVTIAMKNNFGAIHNPNKYHFDPLHRALADLNSMSLIRSKTRLVVCDASRVVYNGGPAFKPQWTDWYGGILMSRDPVAMDATGWRIIEQLRKQKGLPTLQEAGRPPRYIELAAAEPYRLGRAREDEIERVEIQL